jgi:2',3'-cyclic-nucleotide 2'-phosphodiesterase (5'-nucleotidase family)
MLLSLLFALLQVPAEAPLHLIVLHTNDVHGQALPRPATWLKEPGKESGGLERLVAAVAAVRAEAAREGAEVLLLDGGDWFQGTPEGALDGGVAFARLLSQVGYDAMVLGNHEFDLGLPPLLQLLEEAPIRALCANLSQKEPDGSLTPVPWVEPARLFQRGGLDIAVIGLLTPSTPYISHPDARGLVFGEPAAAFRAARAALPGGVELVLALTHLGTEDDLELARAVPDLPLIVGGHSHTFLREGIRQGQTLIVQAGSKASALGRVDLMLERPSGRILSQNSRLIDLYEPAPADAVPAEFKRQLAQLVERGSASMDESVGELVDVGPPGDRFATSGLGNWFTDSFRRAANADLAVHNRGGIRKTLVVGPLARRDLFEVMPFDNTLVVLELTGAELDKVFAKALGGKERANLEFSGCLLEYRLDRDGLSQYVRAWKDGRPLEPERRYRLATNSFLARGGDRLFSDLGEPPFEDSGLLIREVLEAEVRAVGRVYFSPENRYLQR